ncbi:hypothetical protein ACFWXO_30845 [Kitasatospora sp. NPDC059088]|uniref:hypothetical protein n=1 Tax=Kitasatospora sp. NPDC059088 TaxID=3346722 RepID=UPI0036BF77D3
MSDQTNELTPWTLKTLRDLARQTRNLPADTLIVMSTDPSGNHFNPVLEYDTGMFADDELYPTQEQRARLIKGGEAPDAIPATPPGAKFALCLWPMPVF